VEQHTGAVLAPRMDASATPFLEDGAGLKVVQDFLGHASL
jgi:site-specific recombinase XerD